MFVCGGESAWTTRSTGRLSLAYVAGIPTRARFIGRVRRRRTSSEVERVFSKLRRHIEVIVFVQLPDGTVVENRTLLNIHKPFSIGRIS